MHGAAQQCSLHSLLGYQPWSQILPAMIFAGPFAGPAAGPIAPGYAPPPTDASLNRISQEFTYQDIADATENFSSANRLGEGTYGTVFRGTLRDGTEVAVKALSKPKEGGFKEEVEVLSKFRHPNLVILLGFARNQKQRYLVYELLPGGDVNSRLNKDAEFTWMPRLSVAVDAALGLSHLHGSRPQVFHRDVKTQNILMDRNGTGKVADFGLALLAQQHQKQMAVAETSGTIGYADPLYIRTGVVTEQSEVYSFGMVMLELMTGRPPALQHPSGRIQFQFEHLRSNLRNLMPMVDARAKWPPLMVEKFGTLALQCIHDQDKTRPTFRDVLSNLRAWLRDKSLHQVASGSPSAGLEPAAAQQGAVFGGYPQAAGAGRDAGSQGYAGQLAAAQQAAAQQAAAAQMAGRGTDPRYAAAQASREAAAARDAAARDAAARDALARDAAARNAARDAAWRAEAASGDARWVSMAARQAAAGGDAGSYTHQPSDHRAMQQASQPHEPHGQRHASADQAAGDSWFRWQSDPYEQRGVQPRQRQHEVHPEARPEAQAQPAPKPEEVNEDKIESVVSFGFTREQAVEAFKRCSSVEAAVEWILGKEW